MNFRRLLGLILWCCFIPTAFAQPDNYKFTRLNAEDGLSHNRVNSLLRDSKGFMWIGTISGLNRFDGYTFKVFNFDPADTTSLINNSISSIFEGPEGELWVTTSEGLVIYHPSKESFSRNTALQFKHYALPAGVITSILKDEQGDFWFLHQSLGIFKYSPATKTTVHLEHRPADSTSVVSSAITSFKKGTNQNLWVIHRNGVLEQLDSKTLKVTYRTDELSDLYQQQEFDYLLAADNDNDVWVYVTNDQRGIFYFNSQQKKLRQINTLSVAARLNTNLVTSVVADDKDLIWIGTDHGGINLLDKKTFSIRYLLNDPEDEKSISQNSVTTLYKDDEGIIWTGTYKKGINYYHEDVVKFHLYRHSVANPNSLGYNDVNRFVEDEKGNLWIGTNGGGLIYFDRAKNIFKTYLNEPGNSNSLSNDVIVSLYIDHEKKLWIGTFLGGLDCFDGRTFTHYKHNPVDGGSLSSDSVWEIFEDSEHHLWIGTLNGGLDLFDPKRKVFLHYKNGEGNALKSNDIFALLEDHHKNLWIGTTNGIDVLEKKSGKFIHYAQDNTRKENLSSNRVLSLLEDSRGLIWIGTQEGLNFMDPEKKTLKTFRKEDGLPHNTILTLLEDKAGHVWIGTPNGLSNLVMGEQNTYTFKNYDELDGLQGKEFNENAALKLRSGELVFGGANGFNIFKAEEIGFNKTLPRVVLTEFEVFNKEVKAGKEMDGDVLLEKAISETHHLELEYRDNVFSLEFAALNFLHPQKNEYRYKLEGFDEDWISANESSRRVTYTNLNPGEYTFRVIASNNDGYWNEEGVSLGITVLPPFWKSPVAMIIYVLLIIGGLALAQQIILQRERMKVRLEQEHQEAQRMLELDMMKTKFFTNVSHEFRTPLSLIITPLERMIKDANNEAQRNQFQMIYRNARRLLTLVNQLLDFRRLEIQEMKYTPSEGDIIHFVHDTVFSFSDISEKKHIRLEFHSSVPALEALFDQDKLEKIMFNLLSNAFKFTPEGGFVTVEAEAIALDSELKSLQIKVRDSGIGIPKEKHDKVFERFFQHETPGMIMNQGSGIGLSITKEFVRLLGGTITLESEPGKGSCFIISLPLQLIQVNDNVKEHPHLVEEHIHHLDGEHGRDSKQPLLLLVEDNEDFRFYLKDNLKQSYHIVEAGNGTAAFDLVHSVTPDLIVADVMMPGMNGIELCKKVKTDPHSAHIPVILLTARASEEQKMEGFDAGANDYITKPFNFELLQTRIKNLIRQQEHLRKSFQKQWIEVEPGHVEVTSLDEKLIQKAMEMVEKNISNPEFSVEELSRELNMSRVNLYKKLLSLTGHAPMEFIRIIRLKRAAQLLEKSQLTVAEVAYQVGFNNPKYFTKYFKDMFKILPSVYAESKKVS